MALSFKRRMSDSIGEPATIVGSGVELTGALAGRGHFLILGSVKGDSAIDGPVTLAEGARWEGTLGATDVVIAGEIVGDLAASGRIEIRPGARIRGSVTGASIAIAEGAVIEGQMTTTAETEIHRFVEKRTGSDRSGRKKVRRQR